MEFELSPLHLIHEQWEADHAVHTLRAKKLRDSDAVLGCGSADIGVPASASAAITCAHTAEQGDETRKRAALNLGDTGESPLPLKFGRAAQTPERRAWPSERHRATLADRPAGPQTQRSTAIAPRGGATGAGPRAGRGSMRLSSGAPRG